MPLQVLSPEDILSSRSGESIFLYGPPGHGKTSLIATAKDPLILLSDPGGATPLIAPRFKDKLKKRIVLIRSYEDLESAIEALSTGKLPGRDVFWDTATIGQKMDSFMVRKAAAEANPNRTMKPSENEWTDSNRNFVDKIIQMWLQIPNHNVCFVGHQRIERDKDGNITGYNPDILPQSMNAALQFFSGVFYYKITARRGDVVTRSLFTASTGTIATTKSRYGIPSKYENPTWEQVMDDVQEWKARCVGH